MIVETLGGIVSVGLTPRSEKNVWGVIDTTSNVLSDAENVKKFDTHVQRSMTKERNL